MPILYCSNYRSTFRVFRQTTYTANTTGFYTEIYDNILDP